jgi:NAD(P)-dependent dehydrogenase (short-subunit alcohol dehydrogenase family)
MSAHAGANTADANTKNSGCGSPRPRASWPAGGVGGYKMAKSALLAMSQSLATELGEQSIGVNSVLPGYICGGTLEGYFEHQAGKYGTSVEEIYKAARQEPMSAPSRTCMRRP